MNKALIDTYTKEELEQIVKESFSYAEVISKLGYVTKCGSNQKTLTKRLEKYNISTEHFKFIRRKEVNSKEVFCEDSSVSQAVLRRRYKAFSNYSTCSICGQLNTWNNKELTMILDHIDGHHHNNVISNLRWICPNCNSQLDTYAGRNIKKTKKQRLKTVKKRKRTKICPICKTNYITDQSNTCVYCYRVILSENLPERGILKNQIRSMSFIKIGKEYGVTDNAVRKWCDKYNLPRTKREINKISEKDWEDL